MKKLLVCCILLTHIIPIHAGRKLHNYKNKQPILSKSQEIMAHNHNSFIRFTALPVDIQKNIINYWIDDTIAKKPQEATSIINNLNYTNKYFHSLLDNKECYNKIMNIFSTKFHCSHETINSTLHTSVAHQQFKIQKRLKRLCCRNNPNPITIKKELRLLIAKKVNLEFIYNRKNIKQTAVMIATDRNNGMLELLLKNGANINALTPDGLTALTKTFKYPLQFDPFITLMQHNSLDINQQDHKGNTPLLYFLMQRKSDGMSELITLILEKLFAAGADPELCNYDNVSPLNIAKKLKCPSITHTILRAIRSKRINGQ
jgi:hypothetical protein